MSAALKVLVPLVAVGLVACGQRDDRWFRRAVGEKITIAGTSIVVETRSPDPTEADVRAIVAAARAANPQGEVETLTWTRTHPLEVPLAIANYAPHKVSERVRLYYTASFRRQRLEADDGLPTGPWQRTGDSLDLRTQVCARGVSFLRSPDIPYEELLDMHVHSDISHDTVLQILADVSPDVPADEVPIAIYINAGEYELRTSDAKHARATRGSILRLIRRGLRWEIRERGTWVS